MHKHLIITALALSGFLYSFAQNDSTDTIQEQPVLTEITSESFQNLHAKGKEASGSLSWNLDYSVVGKVDQLVIRYKRKIDKDKPWKYSNVISGDRTTTTIDYLAGAEKYIWEVGSRKDGGKLINMSPEEFEDSEEMVWSSAGKLETERPWGIVRILILIGSLGLFIFGMKLMSEGLQQRAGGKMRQILGGMTSNRYFGVISGFLITGLLQSSSATTVMTVSFVNAGLLSLVESAGVMMGANIGTTITGWLISVFGFKISISAYSLVIISIGAPMLFFAKSKTKATANTIIGFALLFMGLGALKDAVPNLDHTSPLIGFFTQYSDSPLLGRFMFVILGTLVTIVIQSSSAAMALTLTMVLKGIIPFDVGAAMILGENIGTTITAELASLVGNVHAKRSARIHSMFNVIGVTWMVFLIPFFLKLVAAIVPGDPFTDGESATIALAAFHTTFNLVNVLLMIGFVPLLVKIATFSVPSKGEEDEIFRLEYISSGLVTTPELSILEAKKEAAKFATLTHRMNGKMKDLINETDTKKRKKLIKKIAKYEEITDRIEIEITNYLTRVSEGELTPKASLRVRSILSIVNDLERIADIYYVMSIGIERKNEDKVWFNQTQRDKLSNMLDKVDEAFDIMQEHLDKDYEHVNLDKAREKENEINELRNKIRKEHLRNIEKGNYKVKAGMIYSNLFASIERVGDHIINVNEAIAGQI